MIKTIQAVVFDMDGLMLDTERINAEVLRGVLAERGYNIPNIMEWFYGNCIGSGFGKTYKKLIESFTIREDQETFFQFFDAYRKNYIEKTPPKIKKGLIELIDFLKSINIVMAVCTSARVGQAQLKLNSAGVPIDYFREIITGDMVTEAKPSPQCYLLACEKIGVRPENALALEDSDVGIVAACKAGMKVILIPDKMENSVDAKNMAWHVLDSLDQVIPIIK